MQKQGNERFWQAGEIKGFGSQLSLIDNINLQQEAVVTPNLVFHDKAETNEVVKQTDFGVLTKFTYLL
jgi:hypothetical protein